MKNQILRKFICILKIHIKQNINFKFKKKKKIQALKHFNNSEASFEYSNDMDDIYENIEEYNPNKKRKILIVCDDMIADMVSKNKT